MTITPEEFIQMNQPENKPSFRIAKVPASYVSGRPSLVFDGETTASTKQYPYLSSYTPKAGDKVLMALVAGTYVVLGKIV